MVENPHPAHEAAQPPARAPLTPEQQAHYASAGKSLRRAERLGTFAFRLQLFLLLLPVVAFVAAFVALVIIFT